MRDILLKIKWAYQRVVRGYDDSFKWGMDSYLTGTFIEPIAEFCEEMLSRDYIVKHNKGRVEIYKNTLKLIKKLEDNNFDDFDGKLTSEFWSYFGKNICNFWD